MSEHAGPQSAPNSIHGRIRAFDGLRAVAILLVLVEHTLQPPLFWVGVDIFFVLSGFLITSILLERKQKHGPYYSYFYTRRVFRILPPYLVALVGAALVYGMGFLHFWPYYAFFGMNLSAWLHPEIGMPLPLWSLAVEEQFYFLWPLLVLLLPERQVLRLALAGIVIAPLLRVICTPLTHAHWAVYYLTPFRADLLCAGAALAVLWRHHPGKVRAFAARWAMTGAFAGFGLMAFTQLFPAMRIVSNTPEANGVVYSLSVVGSTGLVLACLAGSEWFRKLMTLAPMQYIGRISYTVYLVHMLVYSMLRHHGLVSKPLVLLVGAPLTIAWAALSWHWFEYPLIRLAARLAPGDPPPLPATPA